MSSTPHQRWYRLIHDVYLFLDANENHVLGNFDLTAMQYRALLLLDLEKPKNLVSLSDELWCARSTVSRLVGKMEAEGLIRRVTDPDNRRAHLVTLSPAGADLRQRARAAHATMLSEAMRPFDESELQTMIRWLAEVRTQLLANLEAHSDD